MVIRAWNIFHDRHLDTSKIGLQNLSTVNIKAIMRLPYRAIRNIHLFGSPFVGAFIYSDALRQVGAFAALVQWGLFPLMAAAGLLLWMAPQIARWVDGRRSVQPGDP